MKKSIAIFLAVAIAVALVAKLTERTETSDAQEFRACQQQIRDMARALEEYSVEHGSYPNKLVLVSPNFYSKEFACPSSKKDTYSGSYKLNESGSFTLFCSGENHPGYPPDMPDTSIPDRGH